MRSRFISLLLGTVGALAAGASACAETDDSRTVTMPYADCLAIIAETAQEIDEKPVTLVGTDDLTTVRINASDGFVTISCSRPENRMTLAKSPVLAAAGQTAAAR